MREPGITQGIIDRARGTALVNGARRVADLFLTMTPAGEDDFFRGAKLHFVPRPVAATCLSCSDEFSTDMPRPAEVGSGGA